MLDPQRKAQLDSNIKQMLARGASQQDVINYANEFKTKFSISNSQTPPQQQAPVKQAPVQQNNIVKTVAPKKEEPGFFEGVKNYFFGEEEKSTTNPNSPELISEKFVQQTPEKPYAFPKQTTTSLLENEYNKKIKAVEEKYNKLQEDPSNYSAYVPSNFAIFGADPVVKTYKVDYTKQKEAEIFNLNAEKARKLGKNITPQEQAEKSAVYADNLKKANTKIEELSKQKKSYLTEINNAKSSAVFGWAELKAIRSTWDHNSEIDANISKAEYDKRISERLLKATQKGVDPAKNADPNNIEEFKKQMAWIDPTIASGSKEARENLGETSDIIMPTAKRKEGKKSVALIPFIDDFVQLKSFKNLTSEQQERMAWEKSFSVYQKTIDSKLNPYYDKVQADLGLQKSEIVNKVDEFLNLTPDSQISEKDKQLFSSPEFRNIAETYRNTAVPQILEGKKRMLSMANIEQYTEERAKAFGTVNQVENIGKKEAVRSAILDKNVEEQGMLSKAGFDKMLYGTAWTVSKMTDFTVNQTASASQIATQLASAPFNGGEAYTPKWTENIINNTDLFDNLAQEDSHFKLSIFKDDKYIWRTLPSGEKVQVQFDSKGNVLNAFGGDFEYTINNPEVMEWLAKDFQTNKDEILKNGTSLWDTEGGKKVFLENAWNSAYKEIVEEMPSLIVEAGAGRVAGALIQGAAHERRLAKGADFMINVASSMTENYPSIYKKYQEAAEDKDNPFPALLTSGALSLGTLLTSHLQSKAIGLTGDDINKIVLPNAIDASMEAMRIIRKEFANIPNATLREKMTNAAIRKVMFHNVMAASGKVLKDAGRSALEEAAEETILEPLINAGANFLNEKITGDRAYNQETLKDLGFLDPDVAITSALTGGTLSSGMDIVKSMSSNTPFAKEDYLKKAFENENTFTSLVDIMTKSNSNKFSQEDQAKMMSDFKSLKEAYNGRKAELGINEEALTSFDFSNPVIKGMLSSIGLSENALDKVNSSRTFDNAIIRQSLNERELAEKKIALDEEVSKGTISVSPEGTYKTVGSNPLTAELEKQITAYDQLQLSNNNLSNFLDTFNKQTKGIQKAYVEELNKATSEAPDILRVRNTKEGSFAYKAMSNAIMDKQSAQDQLNKINSQIELAKVDGKDTSDLEAQKQSLTKTIKASDKTINTLKKQYKAGRFDTQEKVTESEDNFRKAEAVLRDKLESLAGVDATDEEIDQHDIHEAYSDYTEAFKELKKTNAALKKGYGVSLLDSKFVPMSLEQFEAAKNNIKEKNATAKKISENKGNLGDLERLLELEYSTGSKTPNDGLQVSTPKSKEDIDAILSDNEQVYEYAKRLGFSNKKSLSQTRKAVKTYLTKQLSSKNETRLEAISSIFVEKISKKVSGSPMYEVGGNLYKPTNGVFNPSGLTQEQKNTILTNAVISEIAKQIFNDAFIFTPYNLSQIARKVVVDLGFDTEIATNAKSLQLIADTVIALKEDLDAKGFAYKYDDEVVVSLLPLSFTRGYEGLATTPILTVVDNEGNVHLIDFKSYTDNYAAESAGWSSTLTEMQAIFQDNGVTVSSINVVPIRVNNTYKTENGLTTLNLDTNSFNVIANNTNSLSKTLLQLATSTPVLDNLEEEGLLTEEEVDSFDEIPLDETDTPTTAADNLEEDSLIVFEQDYAPESDLAFTLDEYEEMVSNDFTEVNDTIANILKEKIKKGLELAPREMDVVNYSKGIFSEKEVEAAREKYGMVVLDFSTEEEPKAEDKNEANEQTPVDVMEEDSEVFRAGLGKGVYIQIKNHKGAYYTIKIFGDTVLANKYGKKKMTLKEVKAIYKENNWFMPKDLKGEGIYQLLDANLETPILSTNYSEFIQPNGFNEVVNDVTRASTIIGTEVEIVENNEAGYNDSEEIQSDFRNKSSLAVMLNGEKIAMVPPNSPLRAQLKVTIKNGVSRLQPTTARVKDVQFNDFKRGPKLSFSEWESKAIASGVLVPGSYEMVYIGVEEKRKVFKNKNGVTVPGTVPAKAKLGSSYLFITSFPKKNIQIPITTPKLAELGYTKEDFASIFSLIDRSILTSGNPEGIGIYPNFIAALNKIPDSELKTEKLIHLKNLLSDELGGKTLEMRASFTQSQIDKLDSLPQYDKTNQELNDSLLSSFLLDRLITMNDSTLGDHKVGVDPEEIFADNSLILDNVRSKPKPKKQVLSSTVAKNKSKDLVKETYYEPFMTETEGGENYVFFHKSNAAPEEMASGIDSRKFTSLRTSRTEKGTQYGVASYYTLPTDSERMVGGDTYTVSVPKKKVYPMDTDPNGYKAIAETLVPENTPFRMETIKKEMVRMAAEDGYLMAVGMWYLDPAGNPLSGPALRADAIVPLVPQTIAHRKATDKQIDHPMKKRMEAMDELRPIVSKFESERSSNQDYKEGYSIAQDTRMGKMIPSSTQFDTMVAGLPESMNSDIERARELVNMLNGVEETPSANSEVASATMSAVVGRLKKTGLANEVFEMTNDEIESKLVELGVEENVAKQVVAYHGTPHSFDKFSTEYMGTGEGVQAFGWGLYFTGLESIARTYAKNLTNKNLNLNKVSVKLDGVSVDEFKGRSLVSEGQIALQIKNAVFDFDGDLNKMKNYFLGLKNKYTRFDNKDITDSQGKKWLETYRDILSVLNNVKNVGYEKSRNLYNVSLHKGKTPDQYTWLEWDKPVKESFTTVDYEVSDSILSKYEKEIEVVENYTSGYSAYLISDNVTLNSYNTILEKLIDSNNTPFSLIEEDFGVTKTNLEDFLKILDKDLNTLDEKVVRNKGVDDSKLIKIINSLPSNSKNSINISNGELFYKSLSDELGSPKEASLFLLENGIDGIKFPAESISRGATSDTARGFNYVVFDENAITIEEQIKFQKELSDNNITPTTAGFVYNGDVYLNMDKMNLDTPIHEFGHLWLSWAKNNLGEAYTRGLELAKSAEAEPYRQYVMDTQPDLKVDSEEFLEEVLAQAIGDNGARLVEENSTKTKSWLQNLWDAIGKMLGISQYSSDQIMNMTLNDYARAVAIDLLSGRELTGPVEATQEVQKSVLKDYRDNTRFKFSDLIYPDVVFKDITTEKEAKVGTDFYKKIIRKFNKEFDRELEITSSETKNNFDVSVKYETGLVPKYFAYPTATMGEHEVVDTIDKNVPLTSLRHELIHEMLVKHITDKFERINNLDNSAESDTIEEVQRNRAYNYTLEDVFFERVVESIERNPDNVDTFEMSTFGTDVINRIKKELGDKEVTKENVLKELEILLEDSNPWMVETLKDIFENKINYDVQDLSELSTQVGNLFKQRYDISSNIFSKELQRKIFEFTEFFNEEYTGVLTRLGKNEKRNKIIRVTPGNRLFNNPLPEATTIAEKYNAENGLAPMVDNTVTKVDKSFATRLSNAYDEMKATPFEEETQEAYKALIEETIAQHRAILAEGYRVEMSSSEYDNAQEMIDDLRENKRMKIFSTEAGFGVNPITEEQRKENPLLQVTEFKDINNVPLLANDVFRFVHDFFGHAKLGNGFGPVGEENAWRVHVQMYSPLARKAITTETRGQNSWVNFSGTNDEAFKVRDEARKLRKEGKFAEAKVLSDQVYGMMKFAEQKVALLPEWAYAIPSENIEETTTIPGCI